MAYVRRTETLIDDIQRKVRGMGEKALEAVTIPEIDIDTAEYEAVCEAVQVAAYRDAPELRGKIPTSWMFDTDRISLTVRSRTTNELCAQTYVSAPEHRKFKIPLHMQASWRIKIDVYDDECAPVLQSWMTNASTAKEQQRTIETQYREVERQVVGFLRTHASLNAAIKEMPEIELYVPEQYISKMHEPTAPRQKKEQQQSNVEELGIDRNALAAVAIAHRVMS